MTARPRTRLLPFVSCSLLAACCWLISGCAGLTRVGRPASFHGAASTDVLDDGYEDYAGVIHIHTTYSHDAMGTFEEAVRVANAQRLDYLVITEHNTLQPLRDGKQGWHGATLVLIGMEISTRGGHYLALNVTEEIDRFKLTTQQIIDEVNRQGGVGFIAHPYFKKGRWKDWTVTRFTGIEGYNVAHDTLDENKLRLALWTISAPAEPFYLSILDRPYDPLAKWDELIRRHGRIVGIGASDAHEFHLFGLTFAPYTIMFQLSRTHLLIQGPLTPEKAYDALRAGHAYFSIELSAEAKGFSLAADNGKRVLGIMGDEVLLEPDLRLTAWLPAPAQLSLFKDGQLIATTTDQAWHVPVTQPGAYRLEAARHDKPWIFSNPIYVRPAPPPPPPAPEEPTTPTVPTAAVDAAPTTNPDEPAPPKPTN
ncbi:MAG: PHP domain-containing protein [Candidatus Omnitrophica bacterium]|nr:PHP domain-containing protein [Candidatus Omnitrophota bacterium]